MLEIQQKETAMEKYLDVLQKCVLFENIERKDIAAMLGCLGAKIKEYGKNEIILAEGDPANRLGIVLSGSVQILREDYFGNRSIVAAVEPAQLFGESFACAGIKEMPVSVVSMEKSEVMLIDSRRITISCANACAFHSRMIMNMLRVVAQKNLIFNRKIEIMSQKTTREKLMAYLLELAKQNNSSEFVVPFDRQGLADYLGVERSALSAEISKMKRDGVIDSTKSRFKLL